MMRLGLAIALLATTGCGDDDCCTGIVIDAPHDTYVPPDTPDVCAGPGRDKIKFTRAQSCGNDGSVEWCAPAADTQLAATLTAISPTIHCEPGGGRANCSATPGLLLCSYPTSYPGQCLTAYGEMTPAVWDDICDVAAQPPITEIVPTILE